MVMAWTDKMVEDLKIMWKQGLTTGEIGKRLGVSKNSIIGKVHRLGLSGRPSPIKKKTDTQVAPKIEDKPTSKPSTSQAEKPLEKAKTKPIQEKTPQLPKGNKLSTPTELSSEKSAQRMETIRNSMQVNHPHKHHKVSLTDLDNHTCRWPIGDPKDDTFHFCGKKVKIGQTYCDEHSA